MKKKGCRNRQPFSLEQGTVTHAACGSQGGDGCREHGHNYLNSLAFDECPDLFFDVAPDTHSSPPSV